jgi:peroxiredoxin
MTMRFAKALGALVVAGVVGFVGFNRVSAATGESEIASPREVDNFRLTDQNLRSHELYRLADARAVVLITQQNGCPICRNTSPAVKALQAAYGAKGVEIMMLNSTPLDTREEIAAEAKAYGYEVPVLLDHNQLVGEQLGVTRTAEAIIIDPRTWTIVYRGPIDDRVTYERQKARPEHTWAADALDALLAGRPVAHVRQPPLGCLIDFPERGAIAATQVSYASDIAPIIREKCVACHQPGGIGPMPLTSYSRVKSWSPMILKVIRTQRMPPWRADPTVGKFQDDKSLSPEQIRKIVHWVEAGAPRGKGEDPLGAVTFEAPEWPLGKPDLILDMPAYAIPATGVVDYQRPFTLNPSTQGHWLRASTFKVENRQAIHHILTGYIATPPESGVQAYEDRWGASVGGYAVGAESVVQPTNVGVYIPPGGAVGFQAHYTPFGRAVTEHAKIALYFYDQPPELVMHNSVIANPNILIPPNADSYTKSAYLLFPKDALLYAAFPHAHYRGASAQLSIRFPDGKQKLVLALPNYDFNWQRDYNFAEPIAVPAGSKLVATFVYDNSRRNPANPDYNRTVPWGEQSFDEMLYMSVRYRWSGETSQKPTDFDVELNKTLYFNILDENMDDKLDLSEFKGRRGEGLKPYFTAMDTDHNGSVSRAELEAAQAVLRRMRKSAAAAKPR